MDTNKVYFADAYIVNEVEKLDFFIERYAYIQSKYLKTVLIRCKKNMFGKVIAKDLNSNQIYKLSIPCKTGRIWVKTTSLQSFNKVAKNMQNNLPKRKIKEIGNRKLYQNN